MSNEPIPRTSEEWRRIQRLPNGSYTSKLTYRELAHGMSNFAEQLERELAQSQEANAGLMKACDALERELTAMTEQRDKLAEALRVATSYPLTESWYKQAIEALAKLKPCD